MRLPQRMSIVKIYQNCQHSTYIPYNIGTVNKVHENLQFLKNCLTESQLTANKISNHCKINISYIIPER